jgi:hypothetical protein
VQPYTLVEFFQPQKRGFLRIPEFTGIPEDAVCTQVRFSMEHDAFMFLFYHKNFKKIPTGEPFPIKFTELNTVEINWA